MNINRLLLYLSLLMLAVLSGCSADARGHPSAADLAAISEQAETLYQANCLPCHGVNLDGGVGPALNEIGKKQSAKQMTAQILHGGRRMPGFQSRLTEDEVQILVQWLKAQQ